MTNQLNVQPVALDHLPPGCRVGRNVRVHAARCRIGENVSLGDGVTLVAEDMVIGDGVTIGAGTDLRATSLHVGGDSEIAAGVRVLVAERFRVEEATRIAPGAAIVCRDFVAGRLLYFGDGSTVGYGGTATSTAVVRIGDRVTIGQHSILNANCEIRIGDNVGTGSYLAIWTHGYHFGHGPLMGVRPAYAPVSVERNVWLGFHVTILPGVEIGENTMVAAGSVVTAPVPRDVLVGGVPAKIKKRLDNEAVTGERADEAVAEVFRTWRGELLWKGCEITGDDPERGLVVATPDGGDRLRVVFLPHDRKAGAEGTERRDDLPLAVVTVEDRPELGVDDDTLTVFELRSGVLRGPTSPIVEDLRDQLRRHAMPCGDTRCFTSIPPAPFAALLAAVP
ncbi:DapH/DapD/GlmU-related protein [Streptosporangium sp. DT93]|uniref:DapH/DapD/GlmU-related protein n=1 Tax=Streptosporangium sp. DT93 TaxID=3393428 RepID=UPI003CF520BF